MAWAGERLSLIVLIGAAFIVAILALILIPIFYEAPSCTDYTQNQGEAGVDCGQPCAYLCVDQKSAPIVSLVRALTQTSHRVDVIAYVENPNFDAAARNVAYKITLYAADHTILKTNVVIIDLPAGARVPVYAPSFFTFTDNVSGVQGFLEVVTDSLRWVMSSPPPIPTVSDVKLGGTTLEPRITAVLSNPGTAAFRNINVTVVVYDSSKNIIAASQTFIPTIAGESSALATFTWPEAFSGTPARIEVTPTPALPTGKEGIAP